MYSIFNEDAMRRKSALLRLLFARMSSFSGLLKVSRVRRVRRKENGNV